MLKPHLNTETENAQSLVGGVISEVWRTSPETPLKSWEACFTFGYYEGNRHKLPCLWTPVSFSTVSCNPLMLLLRIAFKFFNVG